MSYYHHLILKGRLADALEAAKDHNVPIEQSKAREIPRVYGGVEASYETVLRTPAETDEEADKMDTVLAEWMNEKPEEVDDRYVPGTLLFYERRIGIGIS